MNRINHILHLATMITLLSIPVGAQTLDLDSTGIAESSVLTPAAWGTHDGSYDIEAVRATIGQMGLRTFSSEVPAIDFDLTMVDGTPVSLSDYAGSFVFLNFWATWCPPCRAEMPSMQNIHEQFADEPFTILALNVQEEAAAVERFVSDAGYTFPVVLDTGGQTAGKYGVRGIPTTFIVGPDGVILAQLVGTREWDSPVSIAGFESLFGEL